MARYNNYHKHSHYSNLSTLDCVVKPKDYIERAKELGHTTYFTTEHGNQGNIFEAFTLCQENDLKCIYGIEAYYVDDKNTKTREMYHIILIAMNEEGRKELNKIISLSNTEGFYYKPRIDMNDLLTLTPENVVVTTACIASRMFKSDDYEEKFLIPLFNHFNDNLFLEVQCHDDVDQKEYNKKILECSKKFGIKIIHANDSHYIKPEDSQYRDLFLKAKGIVYEEEGNFILDYPTYDEIVERYKKQGILTEEEIYQALENTLVFDNSTGIYIDKEFKVPKIFKGDSEQELKRIISEKWKIKGAKVKPEKRLKYVDGIRYEMDIISKCGMADYFLLDHMIVNKAVNEYGAVLTRSGRGSAVSFYVNNLLGLTEVDRFKSPITLYPTRFMSAERILETRSLPDIDLNFANVEPAIRASKDILGDDGVYYMVAFKPLQESSAFRLWCKAIGLKIDDYNEIAKNLEQYLEDDKWKKIIEQSKVFRGVIESIAPSPCSFLLLDKPISEEIGLIKVGDQICCLLDGYNCDVYKYLKNDLLTVQVYTLISETYNLLGRPIDDIATLVNNCDEKVWKLFADGITTTVNQCDSDFGKQILKEYKPQNLAELSAYVAGIRPGFASMLDDFVKRKEHTTGVKELDELLSDSFAYLTYQESIMKFLVWLGIEEKVTYDIIKKIAKKKFKKEELEELKKKLLRNWIEKVGSDDKFEDTWIAIENASHYSFNASHSLSVAIDALYGAYLKSNYPLEYMTVALNNYDGDITRTNNLTDELEYFNITLKNPQFRYSKGEYFFDKESNSIYKGIGSIKFFNNNVGEQLYALKDNQYARFEDLLVDIYEKTDCNSKHIGILIKIGFFEEFGNINKLLCTYEIFDKLYNKKQITIKKAQEDYAIEEEQLAQFGNNISEKTGKAGTTYKELDWLGMVKFLVDKENFIEPTLSERIGYQIECLGFSNITDTSLPKSICYVSDIQINSWGGIFVTLYCIKNGKSATLRADKRFYDRQEEPLEKGDVINIEVKKKERKKKNEQGRWEGTGEYYNSLESWSYVILD